jgi:alkanesulfonate monooxygenase SsuD/methylene tetrahydromethanopterin reductase-like flavin-dependent oxidoreductase (luciferase family)
LNGSRSRWRSRSPRPTCRRKASRGATAAARRAIRSRRAIATRSARLLRPPTAVTFIATLVEDDRLKAEATADLKRHLDVLYDRLGEAQRRTLDRRMVLSQTEPLGR